MGPSTPTSPPLTAARRAPGRRLGAPALVWALLVLVAAIPLLAAIEPAHGATARLHRHSSVQHHRAARPAGRQVPVAVAAAPAPPRLLDLGVIQPADHSTSLPLVSASVFVPPRS